MLSHSLTASPFAVARWNASIKRFENERENFNFDSLAFKDDLDNEDKRTVTSASRSTTSGPDLSGTFSSGHFSEQLALEPSQRLTSLARSSTGSSMRSSAIRNALLNSDEDSSDRPPVFDLAKLAPCNHLVGRENELQLIQGLFEDPTIKGVIVVGPSGSGKSVLALESLHQKSNSSKSKGLLCSGKFDIQNRADPYQAVVEAMAQLILQISADEKMLGELREVVQTTLGEETDILLELVPGVQTLLKKSKSKKIPQLNEGDPFESNQNLIESSRKSKSKKDKDRSITERAARVQNVLVEFLRLVSTESHPVTLLLDDIQWAGPASLHLMDVLLSDTELNHFFLFTTCRQEYLPDHNNDGRHSKTNNNSDAAGAEVVSKEHVKINQHLLNLLEKHNDSIHQMVIKGLNVDSVQLLVNVLLRMDDSPKTSQLATIIEKKTRGNPFFVLQFMNLLVDEDLLTYDLGSLSWQWLEGDIQSQNVADNVAQAVHKRLKVLPSHDLMILQMASCVGKSFEQPMLLFVLKGLQASLQSEWRDIDWPYAVENLSARLEHLVEMGVIECQYGGQQKYDFAHDQIQAAAFRLIPEERKILLQVAIGKRLVEGLDSFRRDQYLFTAVHLCGKGREQMSPNAQSQFAFWAFLAGDTAIKQGAFDSAIGFFDQAAACLGDRPFEKDAELALPLFCGAAEAAYCVGSDKAEAYIAKVQAQTDIPVSQKIRASLVQLKILSGKRDYQGAAMAFRNTVQGLGAANFARNPSTLSALYQLTKTANLLKKFDQKKFLELPECTNLAIQGALSAEATSIVHLYLANPNLYILASCKAVQWSIEYGHTKATPAAMAGTGLLIIAVFGDNKKALEVGESALAICELHGYKAALPQTVGLVFGFIRPWSRPMQEFVTPMRYAMDIGTRLGCMDDVAFLMNTYGILLVLTSTNTLASSIKEIEGFRRTMKAMNHDEQVSFTECNLQFAHKMAYPHDDSCSLDGEIMNEEAMRQLAKNNKDIVLTAFVNYYKMMLNVYFGQPGQAAEIGEAAIGMGFSYGQGTHLVPRCTFFIGISNVLAYKIDGKAKHLKTAKAMSKRLKNWVKQSNPNVLHFLHLLQAELHSVGKKWQKAKEAYTAAITSSSRTGFNLDFALGNELLSLFYANSKNAMFDMDQARYYMEQARNSYRSYGAANKVSHLKLTYPELIAAVAEVSEQLTEQSPVVMEVTAQ